MSQIQEQELSENFENFATGIESFEEKYSQNITATQYFGFPIEPILYAEKALHDLAVNSVAYFSMEFGIAPSIYNSFQLNTAVSRKNQFYEHEVFSNNWLCDYLFKVRIDKILDIPIYGGGLGVLAGDTVKSAADEGHSLTGVGILWNKGYFKQKFWYKHGQVPDELQWDPWTYPGLIPLKKTVRVETQEGPLTLRLWKYYVYSYDRQRVCPIILLDSNLEQNEQKFRKLTDQLYRSDQVWWKIFQRIILGVGGMKALDALGYHLKHYHLNEGHAAFALVENKLMEKSGKVTPSNKNFAYTCHTPVAAGHDRFSEKDIANILNKEYVDAVKSFRKESPDSDQINLTYMCLDNCPEVNAVALKHGEITRLQFPDFKSKIKAITNGVHVPTWVSKSFAELFDRHTDVFGDWRANQENLKNILNLRSEQSFRKELFEAHQENKRNLLDIIRRWGFDENVLTIGWARRIAGYKRPALIFHDTKEILNLATGEGPLQVILAGKAHPNDDIGSAHIEEILDHIDQLNDHSRDIKVMILENYDTYFGKLLTNSVDVWLNNPLPPFEASGTSGMKAILNGVVQLSTLDGWVVEAARDDIGWIFGYQHAGNEIGDERNARLDEDSRALYKTLADVIKLYYHTNDQGNINLESPWIDKMIHCVSRSSFFNTQRMVRQYHREMWSPQQ